MHLDEATVWALGEAFAALARAEEVAAGELAQLRGRVDLARFEEGQVWAAFWELVGEASAMRVHRVMYAVYNNRHARRV